MKNKCFAILLYGLILQGICIGNKVDMPLDDHHIFMLSPRYNPELSELHGPAKDILLARQLSEIVYCFEIPTPLERGFTFDEKGDLSLITARTVSIAREIATKDKNGKRIVSEYYPIPNILVRKKALLLYQKALQGLSEPNCVIGLPPVPFKFLGVDVYPPPAKLIPISGCDISKVRQLYESNPSDLRTLIYLEMSLIQKSLGNIDQYKILIDKAIGTFELISIDFRSDVKFRLYLHEHYNFVRPETCLLFLAAQEAKKSKKYKKAIQYYCTLINRAPASPYAWEAMINIVDVPGVRQEQIEELKNTLLNTYPLIWGCRRPDIKIDKKEFTEIFDSFLEAIIKHDTSKEAGKNLSHKSTSGE